MFGYTQEDTNGMLEVGNSESILMEIQEAALTRKAIEQNGKKKLKPIAKKSDNYNTLYHSVSATKAPWLRS